MVLKTFLNLEPVTEGLTFDKFVPLFCILWTFLQPVDFQLFCCRLGIRPISVDEDLEQKKLRIWGFGAKKAGDMGI